MFYQPRFEKTQVRNSYKLDFYIHRRHYRMNIISKLGPGKIVAITDGTTDLTEELIPYFGPKQDGFLSSVVSCPKSLGYDKLHFLLTDQRELTFESDDQIQF
eukprot:Pgem_evm6s18256